ncbi:hypothetical protein [Sphingomonas sp. TREG-RG-20F-R18-01]|uniref:hypothetical protein n=1 Tax=Sphingomonas sp. TREG-RG-20F-R18-01 TaxID=2914982 RepID=UPI001F5ACF24|nr:hypothetical protein [Sphingomonas sp. TREG-RG-20F-R18-01]
MRREILSLYAGAAIGMAAFELSSVFNINLLVMIPTTIAAALFAGWFIGSAQAWKW